MPRSESTCIGTSFVFCGYPGFGCSTEASALLARMRVSVIESRYVLHVTARLCIRRHATVFRNRSATCVICGKRERDVAMIALQQVVQIRNAARNILIRVKRIRDAI